jgi:hypothetical protein
MPHDPIDVGTRLPSLSASTCSDADQRGLKVCWTVCFFQGKKKTAIRRPSVEVTVASSCGQSLRRVPHIAARKTHQRL